MIHIKYAFGVTFRKFLAFVIIDRGIQVDPNKIEAITTMIPPKNVKELQAFTGKLSYVPKFTAGLAKLLTAFLRLLKRIHVWNG